MIYKKVCNISLFLTSIFVYIVWNAMYNINIPLINNVFLKYIILIMLNFVFAYGFFHFIINILIVLMKNIKLIKRIILASSYIEGVWIGYYFLGKEKIPVVCIEQIEQSLDNIVIVGEAYYIDKTFRGSWNSNGLVSIDYSNYSLVYVYNTDIVDSPYTKIGIANFRLQRKGRLNAPERLIGYTVNIDDPFKDTTIEQKLSDLPHKYSTSQLIDKAIDFYKKDTLNK